MSSKKSLPSKEEEKHVASQALTPTQVLPPQTLSSKDRPVVEAPLKLRPIHALFAEKYLEFFDVVKAAKAAGFGRWYREDQLPGKARAMLRRPDVAAYVEEHLTDSLRGIGVEKGRVLKEISRIAFADPRKLHRGDGSLKTPRELDADTAAAVQSVKVEGRNKVTEYKLSSKKDALDMLAKHLQLYPKEGNESMNNYFESGTAPVFNVNFVKVKR